MQIIHECKDYIIINKPFGLITHPDGKINNPKNNESVESLMLSQYPELKDVERFGIVHRLDFDTSGILIIARTQDFFDKIKLYFQNHNIKKTYYAFVWGNFNNDIGIVNEPIGRSKSDFRKFTCGRFARGELRDSITRYEVIKNFEYNKEKFAYVKIKPETGRTHQIRVHMKHIHHGIVSDSLYMENHKHVLGFERQALHAYSLEFDNNIFVADFPDDFKVAIDNFTK